MRRTIDTSWVPTAARSHQSKIETLDFGTHSSRIEVKRNVKMSKSIPTQ